MSQLSTMMRWEFILEYRYKLIHLSIASVVIYLIAIQAIPTIDTDFFQSTFLFFDPVLIGIMFVGALVLFEKNENTLQALTITPMETRNYFLSKIITLTALSIVTGMIFIIFKNGLFNVNYFYFFSGIILSSVFLILLGFLMVSRCNSINEYLIMIMFAFLLLFIPPMLHFSGLYESQIFYLWPSHASFILFGGVFEEVALNDAIYSIAYLLFWIILCFYLSKKAYLKHIVQGGK